MSTPIDPTPQSDESAAQYRVSAQELAHVVSAIQARKDAEARQRANTVALGEAVEQLGLDMTPDELLAEIQADRARRSGGTRPKRQPTAQRHTFATFAVCAGLAGMMACNIHAHRLDRAAWENRHNPYYLPNVAIAESSVAEERMSAPETVIETTPDAPLVAPHFRPFAQCGQGELADCDFQSLRDLANGKSESEVLVQPNGTNDHKLWTLHKLGNSVFVYVYTNDDERAKAMSGQPVHVYASPQDGMETLLVPLYEFKNAELVDIPGKPGANLNVPASSEDFPPYTFRVISSDGVALNVPVRAEEAPDQSSADQSAQNSFTDAKPNHWAYQAVTEVRPADRKASWKVRRDPFGVATTLRGSDSNAAAENR